MKGKIYQDEAGNKLFLNQRRTYGINRKNQVLSSNAVKMLVNKYQKQKGRKYDFEPGKGGYGKAPQLGKKIDLGKGLDFGKPLDFGKELDLD